MLYNSIEIVLISIFVIILAIFNKFVKHVKSWIRSKIDQFIRVLYLFVGIPPIEDSGILLGDLKKNTFFPLNLEKPGISNFGDLQKLQAWIIIHWYLALPWYQGLCVRLLYLEVYVT